MNAPLSEAEWEQAEPIEPEPTELDEAWKPAAVLIGCIVAASFGAAAFQFGKLMGWWA